MFAMTRVWKRLGLMLLLAVWSATAVASTVKRLDINVVLHDDGSAAIRELWDIDLDDSDAKTEW